MKSVQFGVVLRIFCNNMNISQTQKNYGYLFFGSMMGANGVAIKGVLVATIAGYVLGLAFFFMDFSL